MNKHTLRLLLFFTMPLLFFSCSRCTLGDFSIGGAGKRGGGPETITVLTYNVENFFDGVDNGTEYWDYDPGGDNWSDDLFYRKLLRISTVLSEVVPKGADIVALQEIENTNVLETLQKEGVKNLGYTYSVLAEAPGAAVNTAFLSRYPVREVRTHSVHMAEGDGLRFILEGEFEIGEKSLYLLNNHWKSKSGGAEETEPLRIQSAEAVVRRVREIQADDPTAEIIVCGDLNENPDEYVRVGGEYITALFPRDTLAVLDAGTGPVRGIVVTGDSAVFERSDFGDSNQGGAAGRVVMFSPWMEADGSGPQGSYAYRGEWEQIDHFLLGSALFDGGGIEYGGFRVAGEDFLLNDGGYPKRFDRETGKGFSDHLPLILELDVF